MRVAEKRVVLRMEAAVESQVDVIPKRRAPQYASQRGKLRGAGMDREYAKHRALKRDPPNDPRFLAMRARVYARMGKRAEAKGMLKALKPHKPDLRAPAYAALGDKDEAFRLLFKMVERHDDAPLGLIKTNPHYTSLHSDPRWKELLNRMNLPLD